MPKFKVGDLVTGKPGCPYRYTTEDAVMRVIAIGVDKFRLKIISHKTKPEVVGFTYGMVDLDWMVSYYAKPKQLTNK